MIRRRTRLIVSFILGLTLFLSSLWGWSGEAFAVTSTAEPDVVVVQGMPDVENTYFPSMELLSNGKLVVVYTSSPTHEGPGGKIAMVESSDYGQTWTSPRTIIENIDASIAQLADTSIAQLSDGTLIISFFKYNFSNGVRNVHVARSTDLGATWSNPVIVGTSLAATSAVSSKIVELDNGDLLIPIYGSANSKSELPSSKAVRSTDGGLTWNATAEVTLAEAIPGQNIGFTEPVIANLGGGHLISMHRTHREFDNYHAWQSESFDNGYTWTPAVRTEMKAHCPDLLVLQNGSLLHSWGDRSFEFSGGRPVVAKIKAPDTDWDDWENILVYKNPGVGDMAYPSAVELPDGTIFMVFYDASRGLVGGTYLTVEELSLEVPKDKLDLLSMYNDGELQINTDMTWLSPTHPETGITGAIDGKTSYWNASFRGSAAPPSAYYTIAFNEPMRIRALGVNLKPGYAASAVVSYSSNGTDWTVVHTYNNVVHESGELDLLNLPEPAPAKYVKVEVTHLSTWASLNEISVYGMPDVAEAKVDLLTLYNDNQIQINTDMAFTATSRPGVGITGAIDGNLTYWYSSMRDSKAPSTSYYTIELAETKTLTAVGVNLKPGYAEDAVVSVSLDGLSWTAAAVYTDAVHHEGETDIQRFAAPQTAKFVKVEITKSAGWAMLTELELYEQL